MPVTVYLADDTKREFPMATTATLRDTIFDVGMYNQVSRSVLSLALFRAMDVRLAEVYNDGVVTDVILGSAPDRRAP
jgi:hypothetical protein